MNAKDAFKRFVENWKTVEVRRLPYILRCFSPKERWFITLLFLVVLTSGGAAALRAYSVLTVPVPKVGGSYNEGMLREPRIINPVYASVNDTDRDIARLIFSGLVMYTGNGNATLDLAETHTVSDDGKTHTLTLRAGVEWHDGEELTADDVVFTVGLIQNPQYQSPLRANWLGVTAEAMDKRTVRFTLRTPYAPFIENLTIGIIPKHVWEKITPEQALLHEFNLKPIGSGPYQFKEFKQERDGTIRWYEVTRNPRYYREGPYLKDITFWFFNNESDLMTALRRGTIEGFGPVSETTASEVNFGKYNVRPLEMTRIFGLFFNGKESSVLGEKKVRRAIAHALDADALVRRIPSGGAIPHNSPFPYLKGSDDEFTYNPDESKKILGSAGWIDTDGDGIREKTTKPKGSTKAMTTVLRLTLTTSDWPDLTASAGYIKEMLLAVGIDVSVQPLPILELETSVLRPRKFEMLLFGHVYGYEPDPFAFWHSSQNKDPGLNITFYTNKKVDALLEEARQTSDPLKRDENYKSVVSMLTDDLPAVFLYSQLYLYLLPADLKVPILDQIVLPADRFNEIHLWHKETKRVLR
ncbi:MAG: hypothetical protein A3C07_00695 [Candidatus Sungbacteria bacterium RIFCSPHIGHO2_02_FULL_47_11]|uniref:Solute-binding protein family 5 domain-containing protein n=1 Tax=Candidatus Sungbacteria bacterium RIFCSPHIGHO2_02_FULL_47_11 TaxID=1802270 RepID=A0A1G2KLY8_9BACT|nr:MAG: hypothetical protein A3C07_00695 [Candidatus Sungbacteria bacterium RIFCSPHIGHO2_02_FULL_47_11]